MKYWQLITKNSLKLATVSGRQPVDREIRVKVDKVLLTPSDLLIYDERVAHSYPFIPGRFAIGTVCEGYGVDEKGNSSFQYHFKRNEKVILRSFYRDEEKRPTTLGVHHHGLMRDFVYVKQDEIFHIPPSVKEEDALFMGLIAIAEGVIEESKAEEGDFVLVCGEDTMSLIICQLLLYYKIVPVLITSSAEKVKAAKSLGIFYAYETSESLEENVFRITGGKYCNSAIYCNSMNRTSPSVAIGLVEHAANVVFAGTPDRSWPIDSALLTGKSLTISGIYSGFGYEHTALGILANHVIDFSKIDKTYENFDTVNASYERFAQSDEKYHVEIVKIG